MSMPAVNKRWSTSSVCIILEEASLRGSQRRSRLSTQTAARRRTATWELQRSRDHRSMKPLPPVWADLLLTHRPPARAQCACSSLSSCGWLALLAALSTRDALCAAQCLAVMKAKDIWQQHAPQAALDVMPNFMHVMTRSGLSLSPPTYTPMADSVLAITSPLVLHLSNPVNGTCTRHAKGDDLALTFKRLHASIVAGEWRAGSSLRGILQTLMAEMSPLITEPDGCPPVTKPLFLPPCLTIIIAILATAPRVIVAFGASVQRRWMQCFENGGEDEVHAVQEFVRWYPLRYTHDGQQRTTFVVECIHPSFPSDDRDITLLVTAALLLAKSLALTGQPPKEGVLIDAMQAAGERVRAQIVAASAAARLGAANSSSRGVTSFAVEDWEEPIEMQLDEHYQRVEGVTVQYGSKARLQAYNCIVENCTSIMASEPRPLSDVKVHLRDVHGLIAPPPPTYPYNATCGVGDCKVTVGSNESLAKAHKNLTRHVASQHPGAELPGEEKTYPHNAPCPFCKHVAGSSRSLAEAHRALRIHVASQHAAASSSSSSSAQ